MEADLDEGVGAVAMVNLSGSIASRPCSVVEYVLRAFRAVNEHEPLPALSPLKNPLIVENAGDYAGTFGARNDDSVRILADRDRLFFIDGEKRKSMYPRGSDTFWVDDPHFRFYLLRFGRDDANSVTTLSYRPQTYRATREPANVADLDPMSWRDYTGHYRGAAFDWGANFRGFVRDHRLWLQTPYDGNEQPLTPLGDGEFRVGSETWSPERLRFDTIEDGEALRAHIFGQSYYRTFTP